jgi:UDP-N-acetylglucosamine 1-carboxyvinyltransferase
VNDKQVTLEETRIDESQADQGLKKDAQKAGARVGLTSDEIIINGGRPLRGRIEVRGAKNLAPKAMVAALLGKTPSILRNVPNVSDIRVVAGLLALHGVLITRGEDPGEWHFDPSNVEQAHHADIDAHAGSSRIPILFCGPLLHRLGEAFIPDLGGCRIGDRPIDFHLNALRKFGAVVEKLPSGISLTAPNGLTGASIELPYPSVGATEQVLLTGVLAKGQTELRNAAIEPEIIDLICILQKMGAIITVEPNRVIFIEGVEELRGYDHRAIFDRNEAASWASAALATKGDVFVGGAKQEEMMTFLNVFRKVGGDFDVHDDGIRFWHPGGELKPVTIETDVHPGFMTDWQQPLVVALTQAQGVSTIHETVYENRFGFTDALNKMGAARRAPAGEPPRVRAGRGDRRTQSARGGRDRSAGSARRIQLPHRRSHGRGADQGDQPRHHLARLRELHREAPAAGRGLHLRGLTRRN